MIATILVVFICSFIIVHHLYKIKDDLDVQFKDLRLHQNHISQSIDRIEQSSYQIDAIVSNSLLYEKNKKKCDTFIKEFNEKNEK